MEDILLTIQLARLDAPFGVAVRGLDLAAGVSDREFNELIEAVYANRLIIIKDQRCDRDA